MRKKTYIETFTIKAVVRIVGKSEEEAQEEAVDRILELLPDGWEIWDSETSYE